MVELFDKIDSGILVTHSQGGLPGWLTRVKSSNAKVIVQYKPGSYLFPEGKPPKPVIGRTGILSEAKVSMEDFRKSTQIPIILYYGDNIKKMQPINSE
ncbi:MAG: hypothetical protein LBD84_05525 [Campylobacteraceae bacterium]|jgi:hypothetical protein|nr:hypothetical protein [Campylobacteraceae bacterium]